MVRKITTIEIIPAGNEFPQEHVPVIEEIFASEGLSARVLKASYIRKAEGLPDILTFVLGSFASGRDSWEAFKRALFKTLRFLRETWWQSPKIQLQFREEDTDIVAELPTENENLIQEAMSKLHDYIDKPAKCSAQMRFDKSSHEWKAG